jgi:phosphatidylserine/phosphatidylglycerophosphate/cardiolipin synthase-like enzyme
MNTTTDNTNILEYKIEGFARLHILAKGSSTYIQYIELDEVVVEEIKTIWNKVKFNNKCKHLVNEEIRRSFIDALTSASVEIDIVCPWITKRVLDGGVADFFEKALQKGVHIKILYGIDSEGSYYSRKDDTEIAAKELRDRFSCYGNFFRMKKSNTHYKLLICDEKFYVQGSFNFLSFEGKYSPNTRSEGAQYSENIEELKELRDYYFKF